MAEDFGPISGSTSLRSPEPVPVSALSGNDPGHWQPIETAPYHVTVLVADDKVSTVAVSFQRMGGWMLGNLAVSDPDELEFAPRWWLPWNHKGNPFDAPLATQSTGETK